MIRQSRQHRAIAGESYSEHFRFATTVGWLAITGGLACLVHALIAAPCSTIIARLHSVFAERRILKQVAQQSSGAITFVGLLSLAVAVAPAAKGASVVFGLIVGALVFAISLAFLLSDPELDSIDALA